MEERSRETKLWGDEENGETFTLLQKQDYLGKMEIEGECDGTI